MQRRKPSDLQDYLAMARRQWPYVVVPFVVVCFMTIVIAAKLPKSYKSETLILVDPQKLPPEILKSAGTDVSGRLQVISQQVMSRTQLDKIIAQFGLYKNKRSADDIVEQMRKDIEVEVVQDDRAREQNRTVSAFRVAYMGRTAEEAQNVTRKLGSLFIEENLKVREQQAEGTNEFIDAELQRARDDLAKQEEQMRVFKSKYTGMLPEQQQANLQVMGQMQQLLQSNAEGLSRAQQTRQYLTGLAEATKVTPQASKEATKLEAAKAELAEAEQKYTDNHPDVIRLRGQVKALQAQVKQADDSSPQLASQIKAADEEIRTRTQRNAEIEGKLRALQGRLETLPAVEQEFAALSRDYEVSRANYQALLQKKNVSSMHVEMERDAKGENFRILDPASLPDRPAKPNMLQVYGIGLMFGLALGGGIGFMREFNDASIRSEKDLQHYVPLRVLGTMPVIHTPQSLKAERNRQKRKLAISLASSAATVAVLAVLVLRGVIDVKNLF
jgi:polysaccharide chain length determinant protein (PEP-CTERM system associated)